MTDQNPNPAHDEEESGPPIFSSWSHVYGGILVILCVYIGLFYLFTEVFS